MCGVSASEIHIAYDLNSPASSVSDVAASRSVFGTHRYTQTDCRVGDHGTTPAGTRKLIADKKFANAAGTISAAADADGTGPHQSTVTSLDPAAAVAPVTDNGDAAAAAIPTLESMSSGDVAAVDASAPAATPVAPSAAGDDAASAAAAATAAAAAAAAAAAEEEARKVAAATTSWSDFLAKAEAAAGISAAGPVAAALTE